jgi:hypothetical protein
MKTIRRCLLICLLFFAAASYAGSIDDFVLAALHRHGIAPAPMCSDEVFVRRVHLDLLGMLPSAEEVRSFLADGRPEKRTRLIDQLLERSEFADYWAMKWCDLLRVKSEFPINLWPNAVQATHRWLRSSFAQNKPYDLLVREALVSSGSNFRVPPVNFYRAVRDHKPETIAQAAALSFMGVRTEHWAPERVAGMASFFQDVQYKKSAEWKEEIVTVNVLKCTARDAVFPDGTRVSLAAGTDARGVFADWLTAADNPWFARNLVNRLWHALFGIGIIHEPDDIRPGNPPVNPELLAELEREFVAHQYDVKHMLRLILNSATYQRSSIPASDHPSAERNFAHYPMRRLDAEVLIDAINEVTGTTETYLSLIPEPWTYIPKEMRAVELADSGVSSSFLELFGRPSRDSGRVSERNNKPTGEQQLHLLNSSHIRTKLTESAVLRNLARKADPVDELYLTILSRHPTAEERGTISGFMISRRHLGSELGWILINTAEFQTKH